MRREGRGGLSGGAAHHVLAGFEGRDVVGRDEGVGLVVDVVYLFLGMVFHHKRSEPAEVDVVSVGHVGLYSGEEFFNDLSDSGAADACPFVDFLDDIGFGHRSERLRGVVCLYCYCGGVYWF